MPGAKKRETTEGKQEDGHGSQVRPRDGIPQVILETVSGGTVQSGRTRNTH